MRIHKFFLIALSALTLFLFSLPGTSMAVTRIVGLSTCQTPPTGICFTNLADAITEAQPGDIVEIHPGTYQGNFTVDKDISLLGIETAKTILNGGGNAAVLTLNNSTNSSIRRLTFVNSAAGSPAILVQNSTGVEITNTIIEAGENSIGIQIITSPSTEIVNNTFYKNMNSIVSDSTTVSVINNIFYQLGGATAISPGVNLTSIKNNLFFGGLPGPAVNLTGVTPPEYFGNIGTNQDPLFVKPYPVAFTDRDFHLRTGSQAINTGDTASEGLNKVGDTTKTDMGAYGGGNSDTMPFPITDLASSVTGSTVTLTWSPNLCYLVAGYNVKTGPSSGNYDTSVDAGLATSYSFTSTAIVTAPTGTPVLSNTFRNGTLILLWDASSVSGATGYEVRFGTALPPTTPIDVGPTVTYPLSGLENGTLYHVLVVPYAMDSLAMAVTVYYGAGKTPESAPSNEVTKIFGGKLYGPESNVSEGIPERIITQPDLANSGCFLATAAYGSYSAPEVRLLRRFRDAYLMTNAPGRAFVSWYYHYGPVAARFVNRHAWLKPAIRTALLPAIGSAFFLLQTSLPVKTAVILFAGFLLLSVWSRKRVGPTGGTC